MDETELYLGNWNRLEQCFASQQAVTTRRVFRCLVYASSNSSVERWPTTIAACGFDHTEASYCVHSLFLAAQALHELSMRLAIFCSAEQATPASVLSIGDFGSVVEAPDTPLIAAQGATSGDVYLAPAEVLLPTVPWRRALEPTSVGTARGSTSDALVQGAVAQVVARDAELRWWSSVPPTLAPADHQLADILPRGTIDDLAEDGVSTAAYWITNRPFPFVLVIVHRGSGLCLSVAGAVGNSIADAARTAFQKAAARHVAVEELLLSGGNAPADVVAALTPWFRGADYLALFQSCLIAKRDRPREPELGSVDWIDLAERQFGHEPLLILTSDTEGQQVVRAACPGAAVHQPTGPISPSRPGA